MIEASLIVFSSFYSYLCCCFFYIFTSETVQMYTKVARTINLIVVVLMSLEILGASATAMPWTSGPCIYSEEPPSSFFGSDLFEKAEEENEKDEDEKSLSRAILMDLSQVAFSLSACYSRDLDLAVNTFQYDVRPPLHQLNCVFLL